MNKYTLPFRQITLDFHTSPDIEGIGADFDAEEFAATLADAKVNAITLFSKCHHGMLYYDSKLFPERVHPHLKDRDLLKKQIEACLSHGIKPFIYLTVRWDYYTATEHPELLAITPEGAASGQEPYKPGFYHNLCVNTGYRAMFKAHVKELLDMFPKFEGFRFDIVQIVDCSCSCCRAGMLKTGLSPHIKRDRMDYAREMLGGFIEDMSTFIWKYRPECRLHFNSGHIGTRHRNLTAYFSYFALESLPSGGWGYMNLPVTSRYARKLGLDYQGVTGKFHTGWGDFHSLKNKAALEFECFNTLSLGAKCVIGDQLDPRGKLDKPTYELIGSVYSKVEQKEPWCRDVKAVTEIGVFTPEQFSGLYTGLPLPLIGATRMLQEAAMQFDVLDTHCELSGYKLLVLPDTIPVDDDFALKLKTYIQNGGALIASFESGFNKDQNGITFSELGVKVKEVTRDIAGEPVKGKIYPHNDYVDYILPEGAIGSGLYGTEYVMYIKGLETEAMPGSEVLAKAVLPYFNRTYLHFNSHKQAPSSHIAGYDGIIKNGNVIYFSHPIFTQYYYRAPQWCRQLFINAVRIFIKEPLVRHDGPSTLLVTINDQEAERRWVLHALHYIPERRGQDTDIIEDVIPLYNVELSVRADRGFRRVECVPEGRTLPFAVKDGRVVFVLPELKGHQMISLQY